MVSFARCGWPAAQRCHERRLVADGYERRSWATRVSHAKVHERVLATPVNHHTDSRPGDEAARWKIKIINTTIRSRLIPLFFNGIRGNVFSNILRIIIIIIVITYTPRLDAENAKGKTYQRQYYYYSIDSVSYTLFRETYLRSVGLSVRIRTTTARLTNHTLLSVRKTKRTTLAARGMNTTWKRKKIYNILYVARQTLKQYCDRTAKNK